MRVGVCSIGENVIGGLARGTPVVQHYRIDAERGAVSIAPVDGSDIAHGTPCHAFFPPSGSQLEQLFAELVHPVLTQVTSGQRVQGCLVLDGSPLAKFHVLHDETSGGIVRRIFTEFVNRQLEFAVGMAETDAGDALTDLLDPHAAPHAPSVVDDVQQACTVILGLKLLEGRNPETSLLVERLHNPSRNQVIAFGVRLPGGSTPGGGVAWLYVISLAIRERYRTSGGRGNNFATIAANGPFRPALQRVTAAISSVNRPATIPFSHSKLVHLLKPCLCDEIQPSAWIVVLSPFAPPTETAFKDACVTVASAQRVAAVCKPSSFPQRSDVADLAVSPNTERSEEERAARAQSYMPLRSPGEAAYFDAIRDESESGGGGGANHTMAVESESHRRSASTTLTSVLATTKAPAPSVISTNPVPLVSRVPSVVTGGGGVVPAASGGSSLITAHLEKISKLEAELRQERERRAAADSRHQNEAQNLKRKLASLDDEFRVELQKRDYERTILEEQLKDLQNAMASRDKEHRAAMKRLEARAAAEEKAAFVATEHSAKSHSKQQQEFDTYRLTMEPTLRRLRADVEKRVEVTAELEKQLRAKDKLLKQTQGEVAMLQREVRSLTDRANNGDSRLLQDASHAIDEAAQLRDSLEEVRAQLRAAIRERHELQSLLDEELVQHRAADERADALLKELDSLQIRHRPKPSVEAGVQVNLTLHAAVVSVDAVVPDERIDAARGAPPPARHELHSLENQRRLELELRHEQDTKQALADRVRQLELEREQRIQQAAVQPPPRATTVKHAASVQVGPLPMSEVGESAAHVRQLARAVSATTETSRGWTSVPTGTGLTSPGESPADVRRLERSEPRASSVTSTGSGRGIVGNFRFTDEEYRRVEDAVRRRSRAAGS